MSEPTVEIPVRVVLLAARNLSSLSKHLEDHDRKLNDSLVNNLKQNMNEQCGVDEIDQAIVAATIQTNS